MPIKTDGRRLLVDISDNEKTSSSPLKLVIINTHSSYFKPKRGVGMNDYIRIILIMTSSIVLNIS
ncbi:hypothetical protein [Runella zeae]|uniref:hypothetical protein n=1 Tax=Runella zeae TaxID=94255 RepID=UPI00040E6347|nr:hypothetical protein [Runella zeae]